MKKPGEKIVQKKPLTRREWYQLYRMKLRQYEVIASEYTSGKQRKWTTND